MNNFTAAIGVALLFLVGSGWAQETDPASETAEQWQVEQAAREQRQARLDELMATMADEMQAIRGAKSRSERDVLMASHQTTMREAMALMRDMGGNHMRKVMAEHVDAAAGPDTASDHQAHRHKRSAAARPRAQMSDSERLADLENRLDMMQVMMESMFVEQAER